MNMIYKTKIILNIIRIKNFSIINPWISITATHQHSQELCSDIYEQVLSLQDTLDLDLLGA